MYGGKHRSVTLANELYEALKKTDSYGVRIEHRDIGKDADHEGKIGEYHVVFGENKRRTRRACRESTAL